MEHANLLMLVRFFKFIGVFAYGAGVGVGLWADAPAVRKKAIHLIASPALTVTWLCGYLLTLLRGRPLTEGWIVGAFCTSLLTQLLLIRTTRSGSVARWHQAITVAALALVLFLMVFQPGWGNPA